MVTLHYTPILSIEETRKTFDHPWSPPIFLAYCYEFDNYIFLYQFTVLGEYIEIAMNIENIPIVPLAPYLHPRCEWIEVK